MSDWVVSPWGWLTAGVLLGAAEMAAPGFFLLWVGLAAGGTGLVGLVWPMNFETTLLVFCGFALLSVLAGRRAYGSRGGAADPQVLNNRAQALVGQVFPLADALTGGHGRIRVGDSVWRVTGPDLPAGSPVRVAALREGGTLLEVVPAP